MQSTLCFAFSLLAIVAQEAEHPMAIALSVTVVVAVVIVVVSLLSDMIDLYFFDNTHCV